jgi:hypothetical protein
LYLRCASAIDRRVLDRDDAAFCSLAADTLQRNHFRGDFDAMLGVVAGAPRPAPPDRKI